MLKLSVLIVLLLTLSGCNFFAPPLAEQTLVAENLAAGTQIAFVRQTATFEADRLEITRVAVQTAVRDVELQGTRTAATLVGLGTAVIDISRITPAPPIVESTGAFPTSIAITPGGAAAGSLPVGAAQPTPPPVEAAQPPADPNAPRLSNLTLSEQVGGDNCAVSPSTSFTAASSGVYVVAQAFNLTPQNTVTYRWQRDGIEVWVDTWSPSGPTNGQCIWYYITPAQVELLPGAWGVEVLIDDAIAAPLTSFSVTG